MRSFTDVFIRQPVLAVVLNLAILLVGWRALTTLPVQQYPQIESSSVVITTVYYGASAETCFEPTLKIAYAPTIS
jgi:multidrug efflux pump